MFVSGYCAEFAIALHEKTGYPIVGFFEIIHDKYMDEDYLQFIHYVVRHPSGKYLDVRGLRTEEQIRKNLLNVEGSPVDQSKVVVKEVSLEDIEAETSLEEEALEIARDVVKPTLKFSVSITDIDNKPPQK